MFTSLSRIFHASKAFYTALFGAPPTVEKPDYMKWQMDDPLVNFAIAQHEGQVVGVDHLGVEVSDGEELDQLNQSLLAAQQQTVEERGATCCYANSDKHWASDPQGISWEFFHTVSESDVYHADHGPVSKEQGMTRAHSSCCASG